MTEEYLYAFDLSLSCTGLSIFTNDGKCVFCTSIETKDYDTHPLKLKFIGDRVLYFRSIYKPFKIIVEQGFSRFNASTQAIFKVNGLINYLFYDVEQIFLPATTVKKIILNDGHAKKENIRDYVMSKYPDMSFKNLDESDSFSIGLAYFIRENILK